jgi:hypothetical protein
VSARQYVRYNDLDQQILPLPLSGCACRFLYGSDTKEEHKSQVEKSLDGKIELKLEVIFYKKNGGFDD